jgi:hypothetical protein
MSRDPRHPVFARISGYVLVGMSAEREPDVDHLALRLTYRHRSSLDTRRFEFRVPVDQSPRLDSAFPFLFKQITVVDHSGAQWEGREIGIEFRGDYPWPVYADSVRELAPGEA